MKAANDKPRLVSPEVLARRQEIAWRAEPSLEYLRQKERLAQLEKERGPGEFFKPRKSKPKPPAPVQPPKAANDNQPLKTNSLEGLGAIWAYRNHKDHKPEPLQSNWSTQPANDNATIAKSEKLGGEYNIRTRPSLDELERAIEKAEEGDIDYYPNGTIARIGTIKFADGKKHYEKVTVIGPLGEIEEEWRVLPAGAVLGWKEELTEPAGGRGTVVTLPNSDACKRLGVEDHQFIPKGSTITGRDYTPEETQAKIYEAIANTSIMPPVTKCPTGIAAGTACYSDQFIGGKIGSTGKGGAMQWFDIHAAKVDQEGERKAHEAISLSDKRVLQAAMTAKSLAEVGNSGHRRTRERQGRKLLTAANDNLAAAIKKYAT